MRPIKRCFVMLCDAYKTVFKTCTPKARKHTQVMTQAIGALHYQCFRSKLDRNATEENLSCPSPPRFSAPPHATKCILGPTDIPLTNRHCYYADGSPREPVVRFRDPQRIYRLSAVRVFPTDTLRKRHGYWLFSAHV